MVRTKSESKKYNKTPGSHGTQLRKAPPRSPFEWLEKMDRKARYTVTWDDVDRQWAPMKLTLSHALRVAETEAVELMARPDAADLRDARERAKKLYDLLHGVKDSTTSTQPTLTGRLILGGRAKTADEMRQNRRRDNGV